MKEYKIEKEILIKNGKVESERIRDGYGYLFHVMSGEDIIETFDNQGDANEYLKKHNAKYHVMYKNKILASYSEELKASNDIYNRKRNDSLMLQIKAIVVGIVVVIALILLILSLYRVKVGEEIVKINRLNGTTELISDAGMHMKIPFIDKVSAVSVAEQIYSYKDTANTSDNIQLTFDMSVNYKISDVEKLYNKRYNLNSDNTKSLINNQLTKCLDQVTNKYTYDEVKANVAKIGDEITKKANDALTDKYGITVISVSIKGIEAPESVEKSIQSKISKQQAAEASEYEVEKAKNEAEAQKIKQDSVSEEQQQMELCQKAIDKGQSNSPSCYFGDGVYVAA